MFFTSCGIEKRKESKNGEVSWLGYISYKDAEGKWKKKKKTFKTQYKRDAQKMLNEWREEQEKIYKSRTEVKLTCNEAMARSFEQSLALGSIKKTTYQQRVRQWECGFGALIGEESFYDLTADTVQNAVVKLAKDYSPKSISSFWIPLRAAYRQAYFQGKIERDYLRSVKLPKMTREPINYLDKGGRARFLSLVKRDTVAGRAGLIAFYTGMRVGEICALQWRDINYETDSIDVFKSVKDLQDDKHHFYKELGDTKTSSERVVPLMPQLKRILQEIEEKENPLPTDYLLPGGDMKSPRNTASNFGQWAMRFQIVGTTGKSISIHCLRHTFATMAVASRTIDWKSLSAILGHKNIQTTLNIYASDDAEAKRKGMEALSKFLIQEQESDF